MAGSTTALKVLHVMEGFSPTTETFIYDYLTELDSRGATTGTVAARQLFNLSSRPFPRVESYDVPRSMSHRAVRAMVSVARGRPRFTGAWRAEQARIADIVASVRPDILHAHFGPAGVLAHPVAARLSLPMVVSFHGFDAFRLPTEPFWAAAYRRLFVEAAAITCVSEVMRDELSVLGATTEQTRLVRIGKRFERLVGERKSGPITQWVSLGRLTAKKGHDDAIAAFHAYVGQGHSGRLVIAGDGPERSGLIRQCQRLGIADKVVFTGELSHDRAISLVLDSDAVLICSKTAPSGDREGLPTVLVESQALSRPFVATAHSGIPEGVHPAHRERLCPEGNVDAIVAAMVRLVQQESGERASDVELARSYVTREFDLANQCERLESIYRGCVQGVRCG